MNISTEVALTFDDVTLMPRYSDIESRSNPSIATEILSGNDKYPINIPIISANMDCVTGTKMMSAMYQIGGAGILHRFFASEKHRIDAIDTISHLNPIISIGVGNSEIDFAKKIFDLFGITRLCIDVAHGHHSNIKHVLDKLANNFSIMAGNVCTAEGARFLLEHGAKAIKVGVGPGGVCTTRVITGHGIPQLTAISRCYSVTNGSVPIIADGGIRDSGDIVKALAAGASAVMIGKLLAGSDEAESVLSSCGKFKTYWGQSSKDFQECHGKYRTHITPEGVSIQVPFTGPVSNIINTLAGGIRSGLSYSGVNNIDELRKQSIFVRISQNGYKEGLPHGIYK